jgi:hypothetical protein
MHSKVAHFLKKQKSTKVNKSPFYNVKILKISNTMDAMVIKLMYQEQ